MQHKEARLQPSAAVVPITAGEGEKNIHELQHAVKEYKL